jgi:outer membrane protein assembly factor BamB
MNHRIQFPAGSALLLLLLILTSLAFGQPAQYKQKAAEILESTGVRGGLIVHIGCGDGRLTAALCANDSYLVQGLDSNARNVEKARQNVQEFGLYGRVSIDRLRGDILPYIDNLVNLIVVEDSHSIPTDELMRVVAPEGTAYIEKGGTWTRVVKARPREIDEWTHYLHDPTNNAVANDTKVDEPRHMQWLGGPKWSRHHDHMSSSSAIVSSAGRNFYIFDEGPNASIQLPSKWFVIARDAFNGKILWKRRIEKWHTQLWPLKSGPAQLPRRIVAIGDTVYVTLSLDAPLSALDAQTGETIRTYSGTDATEEMLFSDGVLYLVVDKSPTQQPLDPRQHNRRLSEQEKWIMAVRAKTGEILWKKQCRWVVPVTLTVDRSRVLFFDGERVICLNRSNGNEQWQSAQLGRRLSLPSYFAPTLVAYEDVILFSGSDTGSTQYHVDNGKTLTALNASNGKTIWTAESPPSGYRSPEDILVAGGLVWIDSHMWGRDRDDSPTYEWGVFTGLDPRTGEIKSQFPPDVDTYWFHHRCYRAKATDRYLLTSRTGIEFVDYKKEHWACNHWVRGACLYGIMPANGMIYNAPHPCACYLEAKLYGFNALAPTSASRKTPQRIKEELRFDRGPAYEEKIQYSQKNSASDWPTYRCDGQRSGYIGKSVPAEVEQLWQAELEGNLSSIVVADGRLFVSSIDEHRIYAIDAESGKKLWKYTAAGRVDSPPTVWKARVLFGSADGYVYCLRASDGVLIWRYRAAPIDRRLVAFEQVESVWPVHGSVLISDDVLWCVAGRSRFLDGGLRLLRLNPITGTKLSETLLDERDAQTGRNLQVHIKGLNMPVALPDILSTDGDYVYMKSQKFDKHGKPLDIKTPTENIRQQQGRGAHLFCPTGFLDDAYWHRSYWVYGQRWASGAGGYFKAGRFAPSGRVLVFDDSTVYGFSRKPQYFKWTTPLERQLFASSKEPEIIRTRPPDKRKGFSAARPPEIRIAWQWGKDIPLHVRAMVLAGQTLFMAGPPDLVDEEKSIRNYADPKIQTKLSEQNGALEGKKGSLLWAVSAKDGQRLAEYKIDTLPAWDGMAVANECLYMSTTDGRILCFGNR